MTIDPEQLMAYADGELDPLTAKRLEKAMAADPALAAEVERHRALRRRIDRAFAPIAAEPVPDALAAMLRATVVPLLPPARPRPHRWQRGGIAAALAACLVLGIGIGSTLDRGPVRQQDGALVAGGTLSETLDRAASGGTGPIRVALSFRTADRSYCRVFTAPVADGIACRRDGAWRLMQTRSGSHTGPEPAYAQAGSADAALMAAAQDMMAGTPLDAGAEAAARARGWR